MGIGIYHNAPLCAVYEKARMAGYQLDVA